MSVGAKKTALVGLGLGVGLLGMGLLAPGCASSVPVSPPRAFLGAARMAFVCFDLSDEALPRAVPLEECRPVTLDLDNMGRQTFATDRALHALVTQVTRGEVAAVDLTTRVILDSDPRIPGATFVPVGALPTDIVVPEGNATCAWVASATDRTIAAIPSVRFRPEHDRDVPDFISQVALPGRPAELVLVEEPGSDRGTLWVSMPDLGAVARIAIDTGTCVAGAPDLINLTVSVPPGVPAQPGVDLARVCPLDLAVASPASIAPRTYVADDPEARPYALELDRGDVSDPTDDVLLIADENLPLIHRVDLATASELTPLSVGAPVRDLSVTPRVPDAYTVGAPLGSRFLYAIDDVDGTVMAIEYSDPSDAGFGAVLPIDGAQSVRPDRMPMPIGARALDVLTPGFQTDALDPLVPTDSEDDYYEGLCVPGVTGVDRPDPQARPATLRGVFLSMAMTDGTVRVADIFDLDAPCRGRDYESGGGEDCTNPTQGADLNVYIRRHRLRAGVFLTRLASVFEGPNLVRSGANLPLSAEEGSAGFSPSLTPVTTCPAGMGRIYPSTEDASTFLCSQLDPFAAAAETWVIGWQGALASTGRSDGNWDEVGGEVVLDGGLDLCARGVLSAEAAAAIPAGEPEAGYLGDLLAITTPIDPEVLELPDGRRCQAVVGITEAGQTAQPILIPIVRAFTRPTGLIEPYIGRVVLAPDAPIIDAATGLPRPGVTLADARFCLNAEVVDGRVVEGLEELVRYDIRSQGAYTVTGSRTAFLHRVTRAVDGACTLDATLPAAWQGRARTGVPFASTRLAFQLGLVDSLPPIAGAEIRFRIGIVSSGFGSVADAQLLLDLGSNGSGGRLLTLPSEVAWNDRVQHLFVLEPERRGLVEMTTLPFGVVSGTRFE
jgi:hypothetical protein